MVEKNKTGGGTYFAYLIEPNWNCCLWIFLPKNPSHQEGKINMSLIFGIAALGLLCGAIGQGLRLRQSDRGRHPRNQQGSLLAVYANMTPEAKAKAEQSVLGIKA